MIYIEHEGILYRGPSRAVPQELWNGKRFVPYEGDVPKPVDWGDKISEADAREMMGQAGEQQQGQQQKAAE